MSTGAPVPTAAVEQALAAEGYRAIVGVDEVGRGAWAGPVSVGAVVAPTGVAAPVGLRDSKLVPERRRDALFEAVVDWCTAWAVGHAGPDECDRWGMTVALRLAGRRALDQLEVQPDVVLLDGSFDYLTDPEPLTDPGFPPVRTVVRGDMTCTSIAAASIVAKVTRDRMMRELAADFPGFAFDRNKGYPSPVHRTALTDSGLTSIHRRSWSYVDKLPIR